MALGALVLAVAGGDFGANIYAGGLKGKSSGKDYERV